MVHAFLILAQGNYSSSSFAAQEVWRVPDSEMSNLIWHEYNIAKFPVKSRDSGTDARTVRIAPTTYREQSETSMCRCTWK